MKSLSIIECRTCGTQFIDIKSEITIIPGEEVDVTLRTIQHCSQCKLHAERTPSQRFPKHPGEQEW